MGFSTKERRRVATRVCGSIVEKFWGDIREGWLYGSVARGNDWEFSDIDMRFLMCSLSPLAKGYENPRVAKFAHELKEKMKREGYDVSIEFQPYDEFYEMVARANQLKGSNVDKDLWPMPINIFNEGILLYKLIPQN